MSFLIKPYIYKDFRGTYTEIYNKNIFLKNKKKIKFIQDDISISKKKMYLEESTEIAKHGN